MRMNPRLAENNAIAPVKTNALTAMSAVRERVPLGITQLPMVVFVTTPEGTKRPPNEWRLSCGAGLEHSQGEFYLTARKTFSGSIGDGRRQLQALVRLRTTSHSS